MPLLRVHFRGVAVMQVHKNALTAVLFPRALFDAKVPADEPPGEWNLTNGNPTHPDGSKAIQHHPLLVPSRSATSNDVIPLTDCSVEVGDTGQPPMLATGSRDHFFSISSIDAKPAKKLKRFTKHGQKHPSLVTTITLRGGTVDVSTLSAFRWDLSDSTTAFEPARFPSIGFTWTIEEKSTLIVVTDSAGNKKTITLDEGNPEAWIANSDIPNAPSVQLDRNEKSAEIGHIDIDFRWVYRLFDPRQASTLKNWKDWAAGAALPAPRLVAPGPSVPFHEPMIGKSETGAPVTYNVSTCFPAIWDE